MKRTLWAISTIIITPLLMGAINQVSWPPVAILMERSLPADEAFRIEPVKPKIGQTFTFSGYFKPRPGDENVKTVEVWFEEEPPATENGGMPSRAATDHGRVFIGEFPVQTEGTFCGQFTLKPRLIGLDGKISS